MAVTSMRSGFSGATIASGLNLIGHASMSDPYYLAMHAVDSPPPNQRGFPVQPRVYAVNLLLFLLNDRLLPLNLLLLLRDLLFLLLDLLLLDLLQVFAVQMCSTPRCGLWLFDVLFYVEGE